MRMAGMAMAASGPTSPSMAAGRRCTRKRCTRMRPLRPIAKAARLAITVAMAAPRMPMSKPKMNSGSRQPLMMAADRVTYIARRASPMARRQKLQAMAPASSGKPKATMTI